MYNYNMNVYPVKCEDGTIQWGARFLEVDGVVGAGDTPEEAMKSAYENLEVHLEFLKEDGNLIPECNVDKKYSGKIALRVSKSLHERIAECAAADGISINSYISNAIQQKVYTSIGRAEVIKNVTEKIDNTIDDLLATAEESFEISRNNLNISRDNLEMTKKIFVTSWRLPTRANNELEKRGVKENGQKIKGIF